MKKSKSTGVSMDNKSLGYYDLLRSKDNYKGTSFKMVGEWAANTHYFNDENLIDFISYKGTLLYCLKNHLSSDYNKPQLIYEKDIITGVVPNSYWAYVMGNSGKGEKGDDGADGKDGLDGVTPQFKIENDYWFISYNNGTNWTQLGKATGDDGINPNYKTYIYKLSNSKPEAPTGTDPNPSGWEDYPTTSGNWWQCIGTVNGETGLVIEWSEVIPVNGRDGQAQDGKFTEFRFAVNTSNSTPPVLDTTIRTPSGWFIDLPEKSKDEYLWMTIATINPDDTLYTNWSTPIVISGENGVDGQPGPAGEQGPAGKNGVSGIPGISIEIRYCIGTEDSYAGSSELGSVREPSGWNTSVPTVTESNPYIWFIQARIAYEDNDDRTGSIDGAWSTPSRLTGTNGVDGTPGSKGQIIYPMGQFDENVTYICDENKAPYVYDNVAKKYYILNKIGSWCGVNYDAIPSTDPSGSWLEMESFEALFTKIAIVANGLIGSAVFVDEWMFSQQGIDANGQVSTNYESFDRTNPTAGIFTPNIAFNFETGEGFLAAGKIRFDASGNVYMNNISLQNNVIQSYENVGMDFPYITSLHSSIDYADSTCTFTVKLSSDIKSILETDKFYSGVIINNTMYDQIIDGISVNAPGDRRFNDEGDIHNIACSKIKLGAYSILSYAAYITINNGITFSMYWYPQNASDFIISVDENENYCLSSRGIGASIPSQNIAKGRITMQGVTTSSIYIDYTSIDGFTLAHIPSAIEQSGTKYRISIPITGIGYPYAKTYKYKCTAVQAFESSSSWTNTNMYNIIADCSHADVNGLYDLNQNTKDIGIVIDFGSNFTPSTSHEILIDFIIYMDCYL